MTLFRKVFQNQSNPAAEEDLADGAALRQAIEDAKAEDGPLKLDPFDRILAEVSPDDWGTEPQAPAAPLIAEDAEIESEVAEERQVDTMDADQVAKEVADPTRERPLDLGTDAFVLEPASSAGSVDASPPSTALDDEISEEAHHETELDEALVRALTEDDADASVSDTPENPVAAPSLDIGQLVEELRESPTLSPEASDPALVDEPPEDPAPVEEVQLDLSQAAIAPQTEVPASGRTGRRSMRAKTRLLGFNRTGDEEHDPFGQAPSTTATAQCEKYPVGWLVIVEGPGVGHSFSLFTGASMIGRGEDQVIRLDFGDNSISRQNHAAIAYDEEQNKFYIGHGGKSNIIRRNARPVLATEELNHADLIRIGETTLRFVALCGSDFQWSNAGGGYDGGH